MQIFFFNIKSVSSLEIDHTFPSISSIAVGVDPEATEEDILGPETPPLVLVVKLLLLELGDVVVAVVDDVIGDVGVDVGVGVDVEEEADEEEYRVGLIEWDSDEDDEWEDEGDVEGDGEWVVEGSREGDGERDRVWWWWVPLEVWDLLPVVLVLALGFVIVGDVDDDEEEDECGEGGEDEDVDVVDGGGEEGGGLVTEPEKLSPEGLFICGWLVGSGLWEGPQMGFPGVRGRDDLRSRAMLSPHNRTDYSKRDSLLSHDHE
ncbi:hypothetical protein Pelo_11781 [Pelomyxa schiedti]|nr:hypothetical protein Pelo_11781 [Pelomyxa schiedti]